MTSIRWYIRRFWCQARGHPYPRIRTDTVYPKTILWFCSHCDSFLGYTTQEEKNEIGR